MKVPSEVYQRNSARTTAPIHYGHNDLATTPVPDESQIRSWLKERMADLRKRAGFSQETAARMANVSIGSVRTTEQTGRPLELDSFLRLIVLYRAEGALVNQLREWRAEGGESLAANGDKPRSMPEVKRIRLKDFKGATPKSVSGKPGRARGA